MTAAKIRKTNFSATENDGGENDKAHIAALVRIACNGSNSATLRDRACEYLGERIADEPGFAAFAARELFMRRDRGAAPEIVFDALLHVIRQAGVTGGAIFRDAVDAVSETGKPIRDTAAKRVVQALGRRSRRRIPTSLNAVFLGSYKAATPVTIHA